ncbi:MAG: hypothetical protein C9356_15580 [Oleiphilus sp.]|nr:MAG: hypothetical protein C9356_15580 [Oleiphilus sp.]
MKGLNKIALVTAISAVSAGAHAELKALDDSTMGEMTGQAGLTIDLETKFSVSEFMYKDAGSVLITGIEMGGNTGANDFDGSGTAIQNSSYLDNMRMVIDVAGAGAVDGGGSFGSVAYTHEDNKLNYGFSDIGHLGGYMAYEEGNPDAGYAAAYVDHFETTSGLYTDKKKTYGDGDLVIHWDATDLLAAGGGLQAYKNGSGWNGTDMTGSLNDLDYDVAMDVATRAVDFNFKIDAIGITDSSYVQGTNVSYDASGNLNEWTSTAFTTGTDSDTSDTILISQLNVNGYLGPEDLHIENNGNGFGGLTGSGDANSKIYLDVYFRITDLDIYIDIAGLYLGDVQFHNDRGDLTGLNETTDVSGNTVGAYSFGFAHSKRTIYAVKDTVVKLDSDANVNGSGNPEDFVDGLALNTEFKGDIDIGELSFGDTRDSIGEIYLTDVYTDTRWTISAN